MQKTFRKGAVGAMMDEYERAVFELQAIVQNISGEEFTRIADAETRDEDCRSIQTIVSHVVRAGYGYANYIREQFAMNAEPFEPKQIAHQEVSDEINKMLAYTVATLDGKWEMSDEEIMKIVIHSRWEPIYDLEQMLEHAIVHVLRHRRQIEKFLLKFQDSKN
jgi:uncharacterized damage-inducible protein DinB